MWTCIESLSLLNKALEWSSVNMMEFIQLMVECLLCVISNLWAFVDAAIGDRRPRMQFNSRIVSQANTVSTLRLHQNNSTLLLNSIANKVNMSNNDGSHGLNQAMVVNIKNGSSNFHDQLQNSLFYDTESKVNESFASNDISHFYTYAGMTASTSGYFYAWTRQSDHDGKLVIYLIACRFENLLNCCYCGTINFNTTNMRRIMDKVLVGIKFGINELGNVCLKWIM